MIKINQIKLHKNCAAKDLVKYGFRKRKSKGIIYDRNIPLYKYKNKTVIEAQFSAFVSYGYIGYDIIDSCSGNLYSVFYDSEWSNSNENNVLRIVRKNLNEELHNMKNVGIIEKYREV